MTDVRQTTATLVLEREPARAGSSFATASQDLVVELHKPRGRAVELAVEAGTHEVRLERSRGSLARDEQQVADGSRVVLDQRQFGQTAPPEPTVQRGDVTPPRLATWPGATVSSS